MQRIILLAKTGRLIHVRSPDQAAIKTVGPGVVRTLNRTAMSAGFFQQAGSTMTTNIVMSADFPLPITKDNQVFTSYISQEIVARLGNLALMCHTDPFAGKNRLDLGSEMLRPNKILPGQSHSARNEGLGCFAKR